MSETSVSSTSSYLDFGALSRLKGEASHSPEKAIRQTAEQFEAYFIQQMLKAMRETVEKSDLTENNAVETYQDMMDKEVSMQMAKRGGVGLANMLEAQMLKQQEATQLSTQQALQLRPATTSSMLPLAPVQAPLPLGKSQPAALPLTRTGAYELQRRNGGTP